MSQTARKQPLKALIVEDMEDDLALTCRALRSGFELNFKCVDNRAALEQALKAETWQVVISDYNLPSFDALGALEVVKPTGIPFFVVSGTIGEEIAVNLMRSGAHDYLMKGHLTRLVPAIQRALAEVEQQRLMRRDLEMKERQLRQAQKMEAIGILAGGIAHDFNNVLASIQLSSEIIAGEIGDNHALSPSVRLIQDTVARAGAMTRQLLTFSRPQAGEVERMDMNATVEQMYKMLKTLVGTNIEFKIEVEKSLNPVLLNSTQLEQILLNLIVNARDAMTNGGTLTVKTYNRNVTSPIVASHSDVKPGNYAVLSVQDTGCGMDATVLQRIFEPFFTTKGSQGTGLGLSTLFGIVQHSGGHVAAHSEVGVGTNFEIYFPALEASTAAPAPEVAQSTRTKTKAADTTILLVEDQEVLRRALGDSLKRKGFRLLEAASAEEALVHLRSGAAIDLMVTDMNLPGTTGVQLIKKALVAHADLRVILMSGYFNDRAEGFADIAKNVVVMQKPFPFKALVENIQTALDSRQSGKAA